ncbi:hypothetical protein DLM46_02700 [Paraburkholderia lacunae]|uniref:Uncharacterized protein n=1 Tax=Paraburkholderia lacunae TaxID=2211104 RepID=A0A370NGP3_9BURK|nr:hypothetical protein DLM46_02700 [Paraburkholderia lacunae]
MFDSDGGFAPNARSRRDCTAQDAREPAPMGAVEGHCGGLWIHVAVAPLTQARAGARAKMPDSNSLLD